MIGVQLLVVAFYLAVDLTKMIDVVETPLGGTGVVIDAAVDSVDSRTQVIHPICTTLKPKRIPIVDRIPTREPVCIEPTAEPDRIGLRELSRARIVVPVPVVLLPAQTSQEHKAGSNFEPAYLLRQMLVRNPDLTGC